MRSKFLIIILGGLFLAGCDYQFKETPKREGNSQNSANTQNSANKSATTSQTNAAGSNQADVTSPVKDENNTGPLILSGTSESRTIACNDREVEVVEESTANSYTLTGTCKKLTVDGVSNKVSVEKVGEISVKGTSNKVTYVEGLDGKKPKITKTGTSTAVDSIKDLEKKKAAESETK